jgi:hypothetical protein
MEKGNMIFSVYLRIVILNTVTELERQGHRAMNRTILAI